MIMILQETIPSGSHNARFSEELGYHWLKGDRFTLCNKRKQETLKKFFHVPKDRTCLEQIGGEEVILSIPTEKLDTLFKPE